MSSTDPKTEKLPFSRSPHGAAGPAKTSSIPVFVSPIGPTRSSRMEGTGAAAGRAAESRAEVARRAVRLGGQPRQRTRERGESRLLTGALRSHRDVCGPGFGFGYAKTFLTQTLDMKLDGLMHERFDLLYGGSSGHAAIK